MYDKIDYGCDKKAIVPQATLMNGEATYRCPRRPILDDPQEYSELFELYRHYKNGLMLRPGGYLQQPYVLMQYFRYIDMVKDHVDDMKESRKRKHG